MENKIIGITGGIGSGKSVVSRMLRCRGCVVYDCDYEARLLMDASESLKRDIAQYCGVDCLDAAGELDRGNLARVIFEDEEKRKWLNSRVHAMVREHLEARIQEYFRNLVSQGRMFPFFVESAILNTGGITPLCTEVWLVEAPVEKRLERVMSRDASNRSRIMARMKAQEHEYADFGNKNIHPIINDDSMSLILQVESLINSTSRIFN